jgi:hypothetical protein
MAILHCLSSFGFSVQERKLIVSRELDFSFLRSSQTQLTALHSRGQTVDRVESEVVDVEGILGANHAPPLQCLQDGLFLRSQFLLKFVQLLAVAFIIGISIETKLLELGYECLLLFERNVCKCFEAKFKGLGDLALRQIALDVCIGLTLND